MTRKEEHRAPNFGLTRVYADGTAELPQIVPVLDAPFDVAMPRRGFVALVLFLGTALTAPLLLSALRNQQKPPVPGGGAARDENGCGTALNAHNQQVSCLAFSPDSTWLASGGFRSTAVKIWAMPSATIARSLEHTGTMLQALAISPDGKWLATGTWDKCVRLWAMPSGTLKKTLRGHTENIEAVAFSPDGHWLVSGSGDSIRLWSVPDGTSTRVIAEGIGPAVLAFSPDGHLLASSSASTPIKLWTMPDGTARPDLEGLSVGGKALAFSPDGRWLVSGTVGNISVRRVADGMLRSTINTKYSAVNALSFNVDGSILAAAYDDNTVRLWSMPGNELKQTLSGHTAAVTTLTFSLDGKWLASGDEMGVIRLWALPAGTAEACLFDPATMAASMKAIQYKATGPHGQTMTYTAACGTPIPAGATCTCNCVSGTARASLGTAPVAPPAPDVAPAPRVPVPQIPDPSVSVQPGGGTPLGCAPHCICNLVPVCQALCLTNADPTVRLMARELLLAMGACELRYMRWAMSQSRGLLRKRIFDIMQAIRGGATSESAHLPTVDRCVPYLSADNEVVRIMAAQLISLQQTRQSVALSPAVDESVRFHLDEARRNPWYQRYGLAEFAKAAFPVLRSRRERLS